MYLYNTCLSVIIVGLKLSPTLDSNPLARRRPRYPTAWVASDSRRLFLASLVVWFGRMRRTEKMEKEAKARAFIG